MFGGKDLYPMSQFIGLQLYLLLGWDIQVFSPNKLTFLTAVKKYLLETT